MESLCIGTSGNDNDRRANKQAMQPYFRLDSRQFQQNQEANGYDITSKEIGAKNQPNALSDFPLVERAHSK
jgi:hypothetical protein